MNEKFKRAIGKNKSKIIVIAILWVVLAIIFVGPLTIAIDAHSQGENIIKAFLESISNPFSSIGASFSNNIGLYFQTLLGFTLVYMIAILYRTYKDIP